MEISCNQKLRSKRGLTPSFIKVNGYRNEEEKIELGKWNLVADTILHVDEWKRLFEEVGYNRDWEFFTP